MCGTRALICMQPNGKVMADSHSARFSFAMLVIKVLKQAVFVGFCREVLHYDREISIHLINPIMPAFITLIASTTRHHSKLAFKFGLEAFSFRFFPVDRGL